jgi:hypothetical protein
MRQDLLHRPSGIIRINHHLKLFGIQAFEKSDDFFFVISQFCDDAKTSAIHGDPLPVLIKEKYGVVPRMLSFPLVVLTV